MLYSNEFGEKFYSYQNKQQPQLVTQTNDETITYDSYGNIVSTSAYKIQWNSFNKANTITTNTSSTITFQYGPDRERFSKLTVTNSSNNNVSSTLVHYINNVYEKWTLTLNDSTIQVTEKYYIKVLNKIVATQIVTNSVSNLFYFYLDAFGSVDTVNDASGNLLIKYNYTTFGRRQIAYSNLSSNAMLDFFNLGFSSNDIVNDERLVYFEGRLYDSVLSRFISPDPYIKDPFNTQSLNRYSYSLNNPFKYRDPSGLSWLSWLTDIFIVTVAIVATAIVTIATAGSK